MQARLTCDSNDHRHTGLVSYTETMILKKAFVFVAVVMMLSTLVSCCNIEDEIEIPVVKKPTYMIYYGVVDETVIANAVKYDIAILHPRQGNITRDQVAEIQSAGTKVLGYIAVGEDLRTAGKTPGEMLNDERFIGDGSGPRIDPRDEGNLSLSNISVSGSDSPGGAGYASYYLDDNDHDGKPDVNPYFTCAYTNIGDPAWYDVLNNMLIDGQDNVPGMKEILTTEYGRGLGCDGLFLDTVDTCAPNGYTSDDNPGKTRFEWTAVGVPDFMARIKAEYPDKLICQNRGLFFYNHLLEHYRYSPRASVDYLFFESYMLDSNPSALYNEGFFADNKYNQLPKLAVEASRPDGFTVLSLGYAEGPEEYELQSTLSGSSEAGLDVLKQDIWEADDIAGFSHYITNGQLTMLNDFVLHNRDEEDETPPVWSSVYNHSTEWPPHETEPRVGICAAESIEGGARVFWDVALDKTGVVYVLYYQDKSLDFAADPDLNGAEKMILTPTVTEEYQQGQSDAYPYSAEITGLESGKKYYMVIRAVDQSERHNTEMNTVYQTVIPK